MGLNLNANAPFTRRSLRAKRGNPVGITRGLGVLKRCAQVLRLDCHASLATTRGGLRGADWPVFTLSYLVPACSFKFMQALREQTLFMRIGDFVAGEKPSQ